MPKFDFPDPLQAPDDVELIAVGQFDTSGEPIFLAFGKEWPKQVVDGSSWNRQTIVFAYEHGLFPMPLDADESPNVISWWSPNPRGVLQPDQIRVTRSLKKSISKFKFSINKNFEQVMRQCADPRRPSGWITEDVVNAYLDLHRNGQAHSVEVWNKSGDLVGGLYGVELGGLFAGESMFHLDRDASKAALVHLAQLLDDGAGRLIDCQWLTEHLASLGAVEISRFSYISGLSRLLAISPKLSTVP